MSQTFKYRLKVQTRDLFPSLSFVCFLFNGVTATNRQELTLLLAKEILIILNYFITFICVCACVRARECVHAHGHTVHRRCKKARVVLSFHCMGPRDQTQVLRLAKCIYLLNHLPGPPVNTFLKVIYLMFNIFVHSISFTEKD